MHLTNLTISRDLKFDTYASFRVRGAIIDGLRKEDWLPRSAREKSKKLERKSNYWNNNYATCYTGRSSRCHVEIASR